MRRRYVNRIEVWQSSETTDSYGGNIVENEQIASSWCKVTTIPQDKYTQYGLDTASNAINIELRYRSDLDYEQEGIYFVYKGKEFVPSLITPVDIDNEYLVITATYIK